MPISDTITVLLDVAGNVTQHPPIRDGWSFQWAANVRDADGPTASDWWLNPLDYTLQLRPLQLQSDWAVTTADEYARLRKTDFTLTSADWDEVELRATGDYFLLSKNTNAEVTTLRSYQANQPFFVTWRAFSSGGDGYELIKITVGQYVLKVFGNGSVLMTGGSTPTNGNYYAIAPRNSDISGQLVQMLIQPYKRNKILVYCPSHGGGFIFTDHSLSDTTTTSEITEAGPLKVQFANTQGMFQAGPAIYEDSATFITPARALAVAPSATQGTPSIPSANMWEVPSGTLVAATVIEEDSETAIAWDGTKTNYRVKYVFSSSGEIFPSGKPEFSPFVYGVYITMDGEQIARSEDETDVTADVTALNLRAGYGSAGVTGSLTLRNAADHVGYTMPHNRLCQVLIGDDPVFVGLANNPARNDHFNDDLLTVTFSLTSLLKARSGTLQMPSHAPFDGQKVQEAVEYLFELCGAVDETDRDIPDLGDLAFPTTGHAGYSMLTPQVGDVPEQWLDVVEEKSGYLRDERCVYETDESVPPVTTGTWKYRLFDPSQTTASAKTFVTRSADATTEDQIIWAISYSSDPPECNELNIDYCTKEGVHTLLIVADEDSQNPETAAESRPANWLGERRWVYMPDSKSRKDEDADRRMQALLDRPGVMSALMTATFTAEYDPAIWPNDFITINDTEWGSQVYRVLEIDWSCVRDGAHIIHRPATYTVERIIA